MAPSITLLYASLNAVLLLVLAVGVVKVRMKHNIPLGDGGNREMLRVMRIHGNAAEYMPMFLILLLLLELSQAPALLLHSLGGVFFVGRMLHVYGLKKKIGRSPGRFNGTTFTWASIIVAAIVCLYYYVR
jgi:uncharacterized protein